ncbi:hypothetical protein Btru_061722 [Bulinus truncatus]|nr:hypothetical protein Btru_061722 [Bulinus truncatus]
MTISKRLCPAASSDSSNNAAVHDVTSALSSRQPPSKSDPSESLRRKSIVLMIHDARRLSIGPVSFSRKLLTIIISDSWLLTGLFVCGTLPMFKFVVGCYYLKQCRYELAIPVYLVTGGFLGCLRVLWLLSMKWMYNDYDYEIREKRTSALLGAMGIVELIILITGCSLVYGTQPVFSVEDLNTCSLLLYKMAYWLVTLSLLLLGLVVGVVLLLIIMASYLDDDIKKVLVHETMHPHYQNNVDFLKDGQNSSPV